MGIHGVLARTPDGEWDPRRVGSYRPTDFSAVGRLPGRCQPDRRHSPAFPSPGCSTPEGDAVRADAPGVAVGGVEDALRQQLAAGEVVGKEAVLSPVQHAHGLAVGPEAAGGAVPLGQLKLALLDALAALKVVA